MSAIITNIDARNDLTIHTLEGPISSNDIITTIEEYYRGQPTTHIIWDFTAATLNQCRDEDIQAIAVAANKHSKAWPDSKTALVLPGDLQFGLGRMYETFAELENGATQVQSFRGMTEAQAWLAKKPL
ncbi:MAG: hypothetical protein M0036_15185 [Desulfobacteraceae bacterium]|nr:hypothetical protein [Desulfobacteraceae bacterium]